jgi:hypothetical protein
LPTADYFYRTTDLAELPGKPYHGQKNHINRFLAEQGYRYLRLEEALVPDCLAMIGAWCTMRSCEDDLGLFDEWETVRPGVGPSPYPLPVGEGRVRAVSGVALEVEGSVQTFAPGELLTRQTAVIHFEKAKPQIRALYPLINQQFAARHWGEASFINREQDLGEPGWRQAKLSCHPERLVRKYRVRLPVGESA